MSALVKIVTKILGIAFILLGIAGFLVDGDLGGIEVSSMQSIVHLVAGFVALGASGNYKIARLVLILFGFLFTAIAIIGFTQGDVLGLFYLNDEGNTVHLVAGVVSLLIAFTSKKSKN